MILRRFSLVSAVFALLCMPSLSWGQFQRLFGQAGTSRLAPAPSRTLLAASCLDYGIKTPEPGDVFTANQGYAFLIGGLPGGRQERLDLSLAVRTGQAVLRGTGRADQILLEVRSPGWSELEIRPGFQALPPGAPVVEIPKATLALVKQAAALDGDVQKQSDDAGTLVERILADARQEHLWALRSPSWQALDSGVDPLQAAVDQVSALRNDPSFAARLAWVLQKAGGHGSKADLGFLGDWVVLRLSDTRERGPASLEVCTKGGVKRVPMTRAAVQGLDKSLPECQPGHLILTSELLKAFDRAGLTAVLDEALAAAGYRTAWVCKDDCLLVQSFDTRPAVRRRFAVIAPLTLAEARTLLGREARAGFAFKSLIDGERVDAVKTAGDLRRLAGEARNGEELVLVCAQRYGQMPLPDGSRLSPEDLPPGVGEVIACDALDPTEKAPVEPLQPGTFTFDALAAGVRAALSIGEVGPMTRGELLAALSAGLQDHWKTQRLAARPVLKWTRVVNGDAVSVGGGGTLLKVEDLSFHKDEKQRSSEDLEQSPNQTLELGHSGPARMKIREGK
jgi:hypothetical protein